MTQTASGGRVSALSPLRLWCYGLLLALFAFVQAPGKLVSDTKLDLVVAPAQFLHRAWNMWDAVGAFGQIQNQAYGYFFPMGPFFLVGQQLHMEMWVVQRLWWTLLLCLAFYGTLVLARALKLGVPWTQVVAAFAFTLSCHVTTILGGSSIEAWPTALAPWVLCCVVRGTEGGSERRWAAAAGLLIAACGGVNAVAVSVVLPLGICWIVTRSGSRAWVFLGWWVGTTLLATLWWLLPLFLMGAYSFPFLDYIENATITTRPTGLVDVFSGTSDWVAYVDGETFRAGHLLATTPFLILDAAALAALGVAGVARRDNPHSRFLLLGVLAGLALVSFGYTGPGHGWAADARQDWLDGALAPLRNLHKYDVVLRLPLVLGLAHYLGVLSHGWTREKESRSAWSSHRFLAVLAVVALWGISSPWWVGVVAPQGAFYEVPDYWRQSADYLNETSDGSRVLVLPAAAFGTYLWGAPRDDVLQPLMTAPWAVRNVVPLAQPGNVVLLDALTRAFESGRPNGRLADVLADAGIGRLVVRNDLDRLASGAPDPVVLHQSLERSPGLIRMASFGPDLGAPSVVTFPDGSRVAPSGGLSAEYPAVEVFRVSPPGARVTTTDLTDVVQSTGGPGDALDGGPVGPRVLEGDAPQDAGLRTLLSDGLPRREKSFASVRDNESATMTADQPWRIDRPFHRHLVETDQDRWQSVVAWHGVRGVTASSSQAWADAPPAISQGSAPGSAFDGDASTAWRSSRGVLGVGQWWQVDFERARELTGVSVQLPSVSWVTGLRLSDGAHQVDVAAPTDGEALRLDLGWGEAGYLRITALSVENGHQVEPFAISEVSVDGTDASRTVQVPDPPPGTEVDRVSLTRDRGTEGCFLLPEVQVCKDALATAGDDGDELNREFTLPAGGSYTPSLSGSFRARPEATADLTRLLPFDLKTSTPASKDVRASALALVDGDPRTFWSSAPDVEEPTLTLTLPGSRTIDEVRLELNRLAPAGRPLRAEIVGDNGSREVEIDGEGVARFPMLRTKRLEIRIESWSDVYDGRVSPESRLPVGVGSLSVFGSRPGEDLVASGATSLDLPCGSGPTLMLGGQRLATRVSTTVARATTGRVDLASCSDHVTLMGGLNRLTAPPSASTRIDHVELVRDSAADPTPSTDPLEVDAWGSSERQVAVPVTGQPRLLVVQENFNTGWTAAIDGVHLESQKVDGWRQGWWLPAGAGGDLQLTFGPQRWYVAALVGGALTLVVVLVLLLLPGRRGPRRASASPRPSHALLLATTAVTAVLLSGWVALLLVVAGMTVHLLWSHDRDGFGLLAAGSVLAAGAATAWERGRVDTLTAHAWTQWLLVGAIVFAVVASLPRGPTFFKESKGRSIA